MAISLQTITQSPLISPTEYRTLITAVDATLVDSAAFTTTAQSASPTVTSAIPILAATGMPNAFVSARLSNASDVIGVTPVALNVTPAATGTLVKVLGFGYEVQLQATAPLAFQSVAASRWYTQAGLASTYGSQSAQPFAGGIVTHVAWLVTTAPAHTTDLYAWFSG